MKILNVIENVDEKTGGGAAERARQISFHLSALGHEVKILTTNIHLSHSQNNSLSSLNIEALPCVYKRFYVPYPAILRLNKIIRDSDIIQLYSHWTILNAMVFLLIRFHKKPYIVTPLGALPIFGRSSFFKKIYNFCIGKKIINKADRCFIATMEEAKALKSYGNNLKNVNHLPNGINEEDYTINIDKSFKSRLGIGNNPFILFIGRLNPIKAPDMLLEAFIKVNNDFPNLNLIYIGPDEGMLDNLKKKVFSCLEENRVHFLGYVSKSDKAALIKSSLFLCVSSHQEAMSIVVLEAGISARPALITDQCGFDEVQKVNGGLVVKANVDEIAIGITKMLEKLESLDLMGKNLQEKVKSDYLWSSSSKEHEKIFLDLVKS